MASTEGDPALMGILALMAADRAEREPPPSLATEVVLAAAGLEYARIAEILGKKPDAVRMKIKRAAGSGGKAKSK